MGKVCITANIKMHVFLCSMADTVTTVVDLSFFKSSDIKDLLVVILIESTEGVVNIYRFICKPVIKKGTWPETAYFARQ